MPAGTQIFHPEAFSAVGCDPLAQRLVVVKSTNHFFGGFGNVARSVHYVDTGLTHLSPYPSNPHQETYHNIERPLWPLDPDPHGIGSEYVPWVRGEEAREGAEVEASVGARL